MFPYVPTYLTYRELPILARLIDRTRQDIIHLIDGQGRLHPRRFGIACHLGVCLDVPTIGVAKSLLVGKVEENGSEESPILVEGKVLGVRLTIPDQSASLHLRRPPGLTEDRRGNGTQSNAG